MITTRFFRSSFPLPALLAAAFAASLAFVVSAPAAEAPSPAEVKLRDMVRSTMIQLRTAQTESATLQSEKAVLEQEKQGLQAKIDAMLKDIKKEREESEKATAELKSRLEEKEADLATTRDSLEKWKAAQKQASDLATKTEAERAKLNSETIVQKRTIADQQAKNAAMFKIGNEILTRYEKFGFGDAITAREPFVGLTRTKLQNLFQDYSDKLVDQRIKN